MYTTSRNEYRIISRECCTNITSIEPTIYCREVRYLTIYHNFTCNMPQNPKDSDSPAERKWQKLVTYGKSRYLRNPIPTINIRIQVAETKSEKNATNDWRARGIVVGLRVGWVKLTKNFFPEELWLYPLFTDSIDVLAKKCAQRRRRYELITRWTFSHVDYDK